MNNIPKSIYQTWKTKHNIDSKISEYIDNTKRMNPDMKYHLYDDQDCEDFIKKEFPYYYHIYQSLEIPVQKADLWRYLIIYKYGGYYLDIDCYTTHSLLDIKIPQRYNDNKHLLIVDIEFPRPLCYFGMPRNPQYGQYWFAATPRHPAIRKVIHKIIANIKNKELLLEDKNTIDKTLYLTGPVPWTDEIESSDDANIYKIKFNLADSLSTMGPFMCKRMKNYKNGPVTHFCQGSWKDQGNYKLIIIFLFVLFIFIFIVWYRSSPV